MTRLFDLALWIAPFALSAMFWASMVPTVALILRDEWTGDNE